MSVLKSFKIYRDYCSVLWRDIEKIKNSIIMGEKAANDIVYFMSKEVKDIYKKLTQKRGREDCNLSYSEYKKIRDELENIVERLDLEVELEKSHYWLNSRWNIALNVTVLILSLYTVLGGMWIKYGANSKVVKFFVYFMLLIILLFLVWVYEGLQMSLGQIRLFDRSSLREYPRLYKIHRKISDEEGMNVFLSGRQLLVVILVFFIAQITSIDEKVGYFPFFGIKIPSWFNNTFGLVFWKLGVGGAFVTLWFAQLFSQRVAVNRYLKFSNSPIIPPFFGIANFFSILTLPSKWIESFITKGRKDKPPSINNNVYIFKTIRNNVPFLLQTFRREWIIEEENGRYKERLKIIYVIEINKSLRRIGIEGTVLKNNDNSCSKHNKNITGHIISPGKPADLYCENEESLFKKIDDNIPDIFDKIMYVIKPTQGSFEKGDIVVFEIKNDITVGDGKGRYQSNGHGIYPRGGDIVEIMMPTKNFIFKLELLGKKIVFSGVDLDIVNEGEKERFDLQRRTLEQCGSPEDKVCYLYHECCLSILGLRRRRYIFSWQYH